MVLELVHVFRSGCNTEDDKRFAMQKRKVALSGKACHRKKTDALNLFFTKKAHEDAPPTESYIGLTYTTDVYIPFNTYLSREEDAELGSTKYISTQTGEPFYAMPEIDSDLDYMLPNGECIPLYSWAQRRWLFSRFDEGIQIDCSGFKETTPEPVANHIALVMHRLVSTTRNEKPPPSRGASVGCHKRAEGIGENHDVQEDRDREDGLAMQCVKSPTRGSEEDCERTCTSAEGRGAPVCSKQTDGQHQGDENGLFNQDSPRSCAYFKKNRRKTHSRSESVESLDSRRSCAYFKRNGRKTHSRSESVESLDSRRSCEVIEACCGFGGNTLQFAQYFETVIAIDKHTTRLRMARNNAKVYAIDNVEWVIQDAMGWIANAKRYRSCKSDWFFASPPWGGVGYKALPYFSLYKDVGGCNIAELSIAGSSVAHNVALYLPANQDVAQLVALAHHIPDCVLVYIENISIGLRRKTKYKVVYFLNEAAAKRVNGQLKWLFAKMCCEELGEKRFMEREMLILIRMLGIRHVLDCLQLTVAQVSNPDSSLHTKRQDSQNARTRGGVFFSIVKLRFLKQYRQWNKVRKELTMSQKSKS